MSFLPSSPDHIRDQLAQSTDYIRRLRSLASAAELTPLERPRTSSVSSGSSRRRRARTPGGKTRPSSRGASRGSSSSRGSMSSVTESRDRASCKGCKQRRRHRGPKGSATPETYRRRPLGPETYHVRDQFKVSGGRFNMSKAKTDVEWQMYRAAQLPGPGQYETGQLRLPPGGRLNESNPKSDIEWTIHRAKEIPGPGEYDPVLAGMTSGVRFNSHISKSHLEVRGARVLQVPHHPSLTLLHLASLPLPPSKLSRPSRGGVVRGVWCVPCACALRALFALHRPSLPWDDYTPLTNTTLSFRRLVAHLPQAGHSEPRGVRGARPSQAERR